MKFFVFAIALVMGQSLALQAPNMGAEYGATGMVQGNLTGQNMMGGNRQVAFNLNLQKTGSQVTNNRIGSPLPSVNVPTQQTITTTYNRVISIPEYQGFLSVDASEVQNLGSPSDLIPIAWYEFWNDLANNQGTFLQLVHASKTASVQVQWRFVWKKIGHNGAVSWYAVWADGDYRVLKHIGTTDLNDIKILFDLPELTGDEDLNAPFQKEALLNNSPVVPNPKFDSAAQAQPFQGSFGQAQINVAQATGQPLTFGNTQVNSTLMGLPTMNFQAMNNQQAASQNNNAGNAGNAGNAMGQVNLGGNPMRIGTSRYR